MALTTVTYSSYFNNALATKQITFTDSTDFAAQGTVAANVTVVAKVESPLGVFYNNTDHGDPDIDCGTSLDSVKTIPLPLDAGGEIVQGLYTITLTYQDLVVPATVVDVKTFTLDYSSPSVSIGMSVDCVTPLLTATDKSNYTVNSVTPSITRDFKIHYPPSVNQADVTGTASTLSTRTFYTIADSTLEHSSSLTSSLSYLFDAVELIYVIDSVTGRDVIQVACNGDICDIYCCLRSQYTRYNRYVGSDAVRATEELKKLNEIIQLASLVGMAVRCGKNDHISGYVAEILEIADCDAGCSCIDGEPQLVTGLAVNGNDVEVEAGTGLAVSSVTGGDGTVTYTVALSATNIQKLANLKNTELVAGTNIAVPKSTATVGGVSTDTWTLNATDTVVESLFVRMSLTFANGVVPVIAVETQKEYGSSFGTVNQTGGTEFVLNNFDTNYTEWATNLTSFTIGNFFSGGAVDYFPELQVVNITKPSAGDEVSWTNNLTAQITSMDTNDFEVRFTDELGNPVNGKYLQEYTVVELIFKINA
jgi:hypothetical protein